MMLKTLSIRTGLLSLLAVMTLLLVLVSGIGIYALTKSSTSLQRIDHLQSDQITQLNEGYTLLLRARNEASQAVRLMEIGMLDDATRAVKVLNGEVVQGQKIITDVGHSSMDDADGARSQGRGDVPCQHAGERPAWPPGPGDADGWERYLRCAPDLEPAVRRGADGLAHRVDRLRLCGNGVVPLVAAHALRTLAAELLAEG